MSARRPSSLARVAQLAAAVAAGLLLERAPAWAGAAEPPSLLYVHAGALWLAPAKAAARELGPLPVEAGAVLSLFVDPGSTAALLGTERGWYWAPLVGRATLDAIDAEVVEAPALGTWKKLPCAATHATLAPDGSAVLCGTMAGTTMLVNLTSGARLSRNVPVEHAALAGRGNELRLVWTDKDGIWASPLAASDPGSTAAYRLGEPRRVAAEAPQRAFAVSPSGVRAVGVYAASAHRGKKLETREFLSTFALDGKAARRKLMEDAKVRAWSADSAWALVQAGDRACVIAAAGGQYKCWRGYRAEAISPDGRFALLAGDRAEEHASLGKKPNGKTRSGKTASKGKATDKVADKAVAIAPPAKPAPAVPAATASVALPDDAIDEGGDDEEPAEGSEGQPGSDESGEGETTEPTSSAAEPLIPARHLYRATLDGAFTTQPIRVLSEHPGPAAFVRGR